MSAIAAGALNIQPPMVVNPTTGRLYFRIAAGAGTTIGYLDGSTNKAFALPATLGPVSTIKVNPTLNRIYIGATDGKTHVLDGTSHNELATIPYGSATNTGSVQNWIAVNRTTGYVYITDRNTGTLAIVNGQTNVVEKTITNLDGLNGVAVSEATNRVYILQGGGNPLTILDGATKTVVGSIQSPMAHPVAIAIDDTVSPTQLYVSADCSFGGSCLADSGVFVVTDPIDPNGPVSLTSVGAAQHGTIVLNGDGSVTYTANANYTGPESFTYTVTDTHGATGTGTVTLNVKTKPAITTVSLPSATVGQPYNQTLTASGGTLPYTFSIFATQLPAGLVLNEATGTITGTPTSPGTYVFTPEVSDADGDSALAQFTIIVGPPAIVTALPNPTFNVPYSQQIVVFGASGTLTWSINKQNSPLLNWLSLSSTGVVSGTPPTYGTLPSFTVTATDSADPTHPASRGYTLNVGGPLDIFPTTLREGVVLETGQPSLPIVGGNGTKTVSLVSGTLPNGVTLNSNGSFSGSPTTHGGFSFTVQVQDCTPSTSCAPGTVQQTKNVALTWRVSAREQQGNAGAAAASNFGGLNGRRLAQTFTIGASGMLTGIGSFNLTCTIQGPVTVEIQHLTAAGLPDGVTLASGSATSSFGAIAVSPALKAVIDEKFAFILSSPTPCSISNAPTTDNYQAGEAFADSGSGWVPFLATDAKYDIPFRSLIRPLVSLGYLITGRNNSTRGTMLANGKILFTGSNNSAEIYDPAAKLSTATGNMTTARFSHTSTLLPNGTVLIVGGRDSSNNFLATAEIFDPAGNSGAGSFTATAGSLATARSDHSATLLSNGKVLIAGGQVLTGPVSAGTNSAELFDPANGTFSSAGSMFTSRWVRTATELNDHRVLLAGGFSSGGGVSAELYTPDAGGGAGTFTQTGNSMVQWPGQHRAALLSDGRVLIVGGQAGDVQSTAQIFDPTTNGGNGSFAATNSMSTPRQQFGAERLSDGSVLVMAGLAETGVNNYVLPVATMERYVPAAGTSGTFTKAGSLAVRRTGPATFTAAGDTVLIAGGSSQSWMTTNSIESFQLGSIPFLTTTSLPDGQLNVPYGPVTLTAAGGVPPLLPILLYGGSLPPGMKYDSSTATLSNTPTAAGVFTLGFSVADSVFHENIQSLTLRVGVLTITSPYRLVDGALNAPYSLQLTASAPATWSVPQGSTLPPGLQINSAGLIFGTPDTLGYYNFIVRAVDANGLSVLKTLSIFITNPLTITTTSLGPGLLSQGYFGGCVGASGGVGNRTFDITAGAPPTGLTLNTNGCFSGTILAFGTFNFTVRVTDSASVPEMVSQPLSISVTMVDDQGTRSDNTQPPLTFGSGPIQKVAQRFIAGITGALRGVRVYTPNANSCPDGTVVTAEIQGVAPNGSPDGNTVAIGSALFSSPYIPLPTGPFITADQQFSVVLSASNTCTITPASSDSNPTEGWVYTSSWQRLSDYDGRSDIGMGTIVEPPAGLVPTRSFLGAHTATRLNDGRVLIVGQSPQAEIFDPTTGLITGTGSTNVLRSQYHQATLLDNGKVLVTGGQTNTGSTTIYLESAELYDPSTGSFQLLASTLFGVRANHTSTKLADGKVLITGGFYHDASNVYHTRNTAVIYDPSSNAFTQVGNMIASRERHTATLLKSPDNRVFVFGGWQDGDNRGEFFDPNTLTFSPTTGFPSAYHGGGHTATLLDDGNVLIAGGWNSNETTDVVELFDPNVGGGTFSVAGTMLHPRSTTQPQSWPMAAFC